MPLPYLPVPKYPDVPIAAGVPAVFRSIAVPPTPNPVLMPADSVGGTGANAVSIPQWGIFDQSGVRVLVPDSIRDLAFVKDFRVADYPIQAGSFESYDKVETPFDCRVIMTKGGSTADRQVFLSTLDELVRDLNLYNVVTPERVFINANLIRYDFERRAKNGVSLLTVSLMLREIRVASFAAFANTKSVSGVDPALAGAVQPQALTKIQTSVLPRVQ